MRYRTTLFMSYFLFTLNFVTHIGRSIPAGGGQVKGQQYHSL